MSAPRSIVARCEGMFPADLARYEAHRTRKGGDLGHIDANRSHLNPRLIGRALMTVWPVKARCRACPGKHDASRDSTNSSISPRMIAAASRSAFVSFSADTRCVTLRA